MAFQSEVPAVNGLGGRVGVVTGKGLCSWEDERWVVLAPDGQQLRLELAKVALEGGVGLDIVLVIKNEVQLVVDIVRPLGVGDVEGVAVWTDTISWRTRQVLPLDGLRRKGGAVRRAFGGGRVVPEVLTGRPFCA